MVWSDFIKRGVFWALRGRTPCFDEVDNDKKSGRVPEYFMAKGELDFLLVSYVGSTSRYMITNMCIHCIMRTRRYLQDVWKGSLATRSSQWKLLSCIRSRTTGSLPVFMKVPWGISMIV